MFRSVYGVVRLGCIRCFAFAEHVCAFGYALSEFYEAHVVLVVGSTVLLATVAFIGVDSVCEAIVKRRAKVRGG